MIPCEESYKNVNSKKVVGELINFQISLKDKLRDQKYAAGKKNRLKFMSRV